MSTRSAADKLLSKPNTTLWSSHTPRLELVEPLPTAVRRVDAPEQATTALVVADDAASLRDLLATHQQQLARPEVLWVAYQGEPDRRRPGQPVADPRRAPAAAVTQVSINPMWSALRFRPLKEGEAPFTGDRS
jgi:hypothetical protein